MPMFDRSALQDAVDLVHRQMPATAQHVWPLIDAATGCHVLVKHENHTPTGAFKIRGGIVYLQRLIERRTGVAGVVTATRGNHGQSQARAATAAGLSSIIVVPEGNSTEKNAAMRAFGGDVIEFGADFDSSRAEAERQAARTGFELVPSFHADIVLGVATYAVELFTHAPDLDTVYVPIGCGSGICALITARDVLGLDTKIVGVVSSEADCALRSVRAGHLVETDTARTFADGMAVRVPVADAFAIYAAGAERIISVTDDEVAEAMRLYFRATHNVAEGAGAAPLAALCQERTMMQGKRVGVILCGGNVNTEVFAQVLAGGTPAPCTGTDP